MMGSGIHTAADKNEDKSVDANELNALADAWFDKIDTLSRLPEFAPSRNVSRLDTPDHLDRALRDQPAGKVIRVSASVTQPVPAGQSSLSLPPTSSVGDSTEMLM